MSVQSLHPPRSTSKFLRAFEQGLAYEPRVGSAVTAIRGVKGRRLPSWLQFLLFEYGLIELTPYVPNPYILLDEGRVWQIERDTWAAVARGLGWVSSPGTIIEAPARRAWWNSFQIYLASLPAVDRPLLEQIEKIVGLSSPFQSDFRRGVSGYDVPALEGDYTKLDGSMLDQESGVRLHADGPLWSFGRVTEWTHELTEAEGVALGNWMPYIADATYYVDMRGQTAIIGDQPIDIDDTIGFARASAKWHSDAAGNWHEFAIDEIAATDIGALIEPAADRLSDFAPSFNPLDDDAAEVLLTGIADPMGGTRAIRVLFGGDAGRIFLVRATELQPSTTYSVSFFARLISSSGVGPGVGDAGFQDFFAQLVVDQWVRVKGAPFETGEIVGEWLDLTLADAGASMVIELFGFQVEAGSKVTSPIVGTDVLGHRAADFLTLLLPEGLNNVVATFDDGTGQSFLSVEGPFSIVPGGLNRPIIVDIGNASATTWQSMAFPWSEANFPWASDAVAQREITLAHWFDLRAGYLALRDSDGQIIGYRRARAVKQVDPDFNGQFSYGAAKYTSTQSGRSVFFEAMTAAGDGAGKVAKAIDVVFGGSVASGIPIGRLWLGPNELTGGVHIAAQSVDIPLRETVRERMKLLLRF